MAIFSPPSSSATRSGGIYGRNSARGEEQRPSLACVKVCHWRGVCSRRRLGWIIVGAEAQQGARGSSEDLRLDIEEA